MMLSGLTDAHAPHAARSGPEEGPGAAARAVTPTIEGRAVLSTLNDDGSRRWIKPRISVGRFLARRRAVAWLLIALFTLAPYLRAHGKPLFLLDIASRHFTLFGRTFLPTDTLLLALFMVGSFLSIFLLTALFGRVWCGWACPQTVYMEFIYRPIERFFEGSPGRKSKGWLAGSPAAKPLKFAVYLLVSAFLAHTFLAWFVGVDRLLHWVRGSPLDHPVGFMVMAATTALMLFDFGFFREQMCIVACPYGRFQSVLLDRDSLIVSYDAGRGEPRGKARRQAEAPALFKAGEPAARGDCVDCGLCVATCPTGIDIRSGLQMECINCTQCIDACDAVMAKLKRPTGLIRYSSQAVMSGEKRHILRPRVVIYPLLIAVVFTGLGLALRSKESADVTLLRGLGRPYTQLPTGEVANQIRVKIVNRTEATATFLIVAAEPGVRIVSEMDPIRIEGGKSATVPASIIAPAAAFAGGGGGTRDIKIRITAPGYDREMAYRLMGPSGGGVTRTELEHARTGEPDGHHQSDHRDDGHGEGEHR